MPDLSYHMVGAEADAYAAAPHLNFMLEIHNESVNSRILNVILHCQVRIDAARRRYSASEQENLRELFGDPDRWSHNLQSLLWTHTQVAVPAFDRQCSIVLPVPCSFDFNIAATKYFHGMEEGDMPLLLLYSGTIFHDRGDGLQLEQIPADKETSYRLPVEIWRQMMARHYPDTVWLPLPRDAFERLSRYKRDSGLPSWDRVLERLLGGANEEAA